MYVVFEWDPASVIQEGFNFSVRELSLCQVTTMMRDCSDQYQIVTTMVSRHYFSHKVISC